MIRRIALAFATILYFSGFPAAADEKPPWRWAFRIEPNIEHVVELPQHSQDMGFYYDVSDFRVYFSFEDLADVICLIDCRRGWGEIMTRRLELHRNAQRLVDFHELLYPMRRGEAGTASTGKLIVGYLIQTQFAAIQYNVGENETFLDTVIVIRKTEHFDRRLFLTRNSEEIMVIGGVRN